MSRTIHINGTTHVYGYSCLQDWGLIGVLKNRFTFGYSYSSNIAFLFCKSHSDPFVFAALCVGNSSAMQTLTSANNKLQTWSQLLHT